MALSVILAALVLVLVIVIIAQNSTVLFPNMASYEVLGQRNLVVRVFVPSCSWTRVTHLSETESEIGITVETLPCPLLGPQLGSLERRDLPVTLETDLGGRTVVDALGHAIPLRQTTP